MLIVNGMFFLFCNSNLDRFFWIGSWSCILLTLSSLLVSRRTKEATQRTQVSLGQMGSGYANTPLLPEDDGGGWQCAVNSDYYFPEVLGHSTWVSGSGTASTWQGKVSSNKVMLLTPPPFPLLTPCMKKRRKHSTFYRVCKKCPAPN